MLRGGLAGGILFVLAGICWAVFDPLAARYEVAQFAKSDADYVSIEKSLLKRGRGAWKALRDGVESTEIPVRMRCARLLALQGDPNAHDALLKTLSLRELSNTERAWTEQALLEVWGARRAPPDAINLTRRFSRSDLPPIYARDLDQIISKFPAWVNGYVMRARIRFDADLPEDARNDALQALRLEPEHFGAIAILGKALAKLGQNEAALICIEKAVQSDPLLRPELTPILDELRQKSSADREQRMKVRKLELPRV
jgi:tetratricopeptide (TPR) repeat protein